MRMRGWRHSPQACMQLQGLSFSWVISWRWSGVKVVSERALRLQRSPPTPPVCGVHPVWLWWVTNRARLVILSGLNHWYQHMSGKGCFKSGVIHVRSELAPRICFIAVCSLPTAAPLFESRWLTVSSSEYFYACMLAFTPPGYVYHMLGKSGPRPTLLKHEILRPGQMPVFAHMIWSLYRIVSCYDSCSMW